MGIFNSDNASSLEGKMSEKLPQSDAQTPASPEPPAPTIDTSALTETRPGASASESVAVVDPDPLRTLELKPLIIDQLSTVYDPEIPVDIFSMGLIYEIEISDSEDVQVTMTLTSPACPVAGTLPPEVEHKIKGQVEEVNAATVEVVWDPPWTPDLMSEAAQLELGFI